MMPFAAAAPREPTIMARNERQPHAQRDASGKLGRGIPVNPSINPMPRGTVAEPGSGSVSNG